jgi:hypothetical protein
MRNNIKYYCTGSMILMSGEKLETEQLLQRIDELLTVLNVISRDLTETSKALKAMVGAPAVAPPVAPKEGKMRTIDDIKTLFPKDLEEMLMFEEKEEDIIVKPRQYLGSENFAKIASIVRDAGGEYISAGKESHFRVPR